MTFSQLMKTERKKRGLTLTAIAEEIGVHPSYMSHVENGRRRLDDEAVVRIAVLLDIDPGEALLAIARQHMPPDLGQLVPQRGRTRTIDNLQRLTHARELQAQQAEFVIERVRNEGTIDWEGSVRTRLLYDRIVPNAQGRSVWQLHFCERAVGRGTDPKRRAKYPKFAVQRQPHGLRLERRTSVSDGVHDHQIVFPEGWRRLVGRTDDSLSFTSENYIPEVFALDPQKLFQLPTAGTLRDPRQAALSFQVLHVMNTLELAVTFPARYRPQDWAAWAWPLATKFTTAPRNIIEEGPCRTFQLEHRRNKAQLTIREPLVGVTFAIVWAVPDQVNYLESRHGGEE